MNLFKIPLVKVIGLLALAMLLAAGCTDTPEEPQANTEPNTFITSYNIGISPDSSTFYGTTVYWKAADPDGQALRFVYWLNDDGGNAVISPDTTFDTSIRLSINFPTGTEIYMFYVKTQDNNGSVDPTPAETEINMMTVRSLDEFVPTTSAVTVPPNGASTSRGVPFAISGADVDGIVTHFQWAVDDISDESMWTSVTPDVISVSSSSAIVTLTPNDLSFGPHTVYFRSIDNAGNPDPSPLTVSIVCEPGYAPEVSVSVSEGFNFVVPYTAPIIDEVEVEITALMDFYYGGLDHFDIVTSTGDTINTTDYSFSMTNLSSGSYWFIVTAVDVGGNSTPDTTNFGVVELAAGDGVLCINGVSWGDYGSQEAPVWEGGAYWGDRTHFKIWDLFSGASAGGDYADSLLGTGTPPLWLIDTLFFDAIVWAYNGYSGDNDYWEDEDMQAAIVAYLESGGDLWIGGRLGHDIFDYASQELIDYVQYSGGGETGLTPDYLDAIHADFTDITIRTSNSSLTDAVLVDHPDVTYIYDAADGTPGLGWIITPSGGGGSVAFIGGRHYRFNIAELKANMDVILADYFGIAN